MLSQEVTIETPNGFKILPVTRYIKTARNLKSFDITLSCREKTVDSKSPSDLMALALTHGDIVTISVSGPSDEEKHLETMVNLMKKIGGQ